MTIVGFVSVKGAPGVTTTVCLVGSTWQEERKVMVVEGDPSGGDLAARFQLSSRVGWPSLDATARRAGAGVALEPHLQQLPGGLDVLVGTRGLGNDDARSMSAFLSSVGCSPDGPWDVLVDLGRLVPGGSAGWIEQCGGVVVCARGDAASLVQVRDKAPTILERSRGEVWLAIVGNGSYSRPEIERFTGLPVIGVCPFDRGAAAVVCGEKNGSRRLQRSPLVSAAAGMASLLARGSTGPGPGGTMSGGEPGSDSDATARPGGGSVFLRVRNACRPLSRSSSRPPTDAIGSSSPEEALS